MCRPKSMSDLPVTKHCDAATRDVVADGHALCTKNADCTVVEDTATLGSGAAYRSSATRWQRVRRKLLFGVAGISLALAFVRAVYPAFPSPLDALQLRIANIGARLRPVLPPELLDAEAVLADSTVYRSPGCSLSFAVPPGYRVEEWIHDERPNYEISVRPLSDAGLKGAEIWFFCWGALPVDDRSMSFPGLAAAELEAMLGWSDWRALSEVTQTNVTRHGLAEASGIMTFDSGGEVYSRMAVVRTSRRLYQIGVDGLPSHADEVDALYASVINSLVIDSR
jgi:hypothetical protein